MFPVGFFVSLSVLLSVLVSFVLTVLAFAFLSLLFNTHDTNIHIPGRIRTRNPSKRSTVDPRLRPLGRWDRQNISTPQNTDIIPEPTQL